MEKIKLNNQVVLMRKHVKQAKVHSINRLVKQVKLLQNRKGNEIQVLKAKRKAEKYLQEISFLKKVRPDYVSKLALSKANDWKEILSQKSSTLEDRCLAILANYGPVQKEVESFHNANKNIISKISDYVKHWEERKKFCNDSSQKKKSDVKALQSNVSLLKKKMTGGLLNDMTNQSESSDDGTNKSLNEKIDSSLLIENSLKLKGEKGKNEVFLKHKLSSSIKSSQNTFPNKNVSNESHRNECLEKNKMEIEISNKVENKPKKLLDNDDKNQLESYIVSNGDSESQIDYVNANESESKNESGSEDSELAIPPEEELDSVSTEFSNTIKEVKTSVDNKDRAASENRMTFCSIPLKVDNKGSKSSENKFKAIAVLNLDDLQDLDEIPVNNSFENSKSSEEEEGTDDDLSNNALQNDPFFLDRDEAFSTENKLVDNPQNSNFVSLNEIFERKEKSSNCNNTKNCPKSLKHLDFSSRHSSEFKTKKKFKLFKKDMVIPKYDQYKFQQSENSKNRFQPYKYKKFDKDNTKNHKEFNQKTCMETYRCNKQKNSNDLYHKNGDNAFRNSNKPQRKNDANNKPLHPSWEAKRKQKELINMSFQGKKIVFED